ncbi:MAG: DUF1294 domain-containing protein [Candidatus Bathyarchaeota archaeon]|nr:DUF1294 domain-containing protein [Candidatus Bathyarchaeum sp.]
MFQLSITVIFLLVINGVSLTLFGVDKLKSIKKRWRIPETQLLLVAFFGPFGAYAAMLLFRHKIRKIKFLLVPVFIFIQSYLIIRYQVIPLDIF